MKKFVLTILCICLPFIIGCQPLASPTTFDLEHFGVTQAEIELQHQKYGKLHNQTKIEDEHELDRLIMIVYPFAYHIDYLPNHFAEIECIDVTVLSEPNLDNDSPNKVICLTIRPTSKEGILDAVRVLEQRADAYYVCPDSLFSLT